jgi:hypothetical protein
MGNYTSSLTNQSRFIPDSICVRCISSSNPGPHSFIEGVCQTIRVEAKSDLILKKHGYITLVKKVYLIIPLQDLNRALVYEA